MIERNFVSQNMKEYQIQEYISRTLSNVGLSHAKLVRTPVGVKIIIYASRPGLIVGKKGANIKALTQVMKTKFRLENPQIEIAEVEDINLDPQIVAERIASTLERFGTQRFKGVGHKVLADVMGAGALGVEILISGKIPSARAKTWRFYAGYLKKCGNVAMVGVKKAIASANLKTGAVGIQVRIMPADVVLPDAVDIYDDEKIEEKAVAEKKAEEEAAQKKPKKRKRSVKRTPKKKKEEVKVADTVTEKKEVPKEEKPVEAAKEEPKSESPKEEETAQGEKKE